jgi:hypothetical protein
MQPSRATVARLVQGGVHEGAFPWRNRCVVRRPSLHLRAKRSHGYTSPNDAALSAGRGTEQVTLKHIFFALITLAAVSSIALMSPSQADQRDVYIAGGAAR